MTDRPPLSERIADALRTPYPWPVEVAAAVAIVAAVWWWLA